MKNNSTRGLFDEEFRLEKIASKDPLSILSTKVNWEQFRSTVEKPLTKNELAMQDALRLTD
ncbi:MAG: hypothetical protein IPN13_11575 [Bacteroidetes bacterium]|nr:hypothetical protein [Bacteroidota bacterium]MBK8872731.1 hypothetical protein [Bacteroidota bacterium]MBK8873174.1 hypothetical protein [Bacteroidota bacterium]MBK8874518.1 hypothetical protein [Bacteroidota bacterium]